jgi:hypothetical protein
MYKNRAPKHILTAFLGGSLITISSLYYMLLHRVFLGYVYRKKHAVADSNATKDQSLV